MSSKPLILITGLEGRDNPYPGPAIAKALRSARGDEIEIVGLAYDPLLTGVARGDLFDRIEMGPLPSDPSAVLLRRIFEIHERTPISLVIPALDSEIAVFANHRQAIEERGIRMVIPSAKVVKLRYKQRLRRWAEDNGFHSPRTEVITDPTNFWEQDDWGFPCWLKGSLADAVRVDSQEEAECVFHRMVANWGYPVLAQEPLEGEEYDICAVAKAGGETAGMICIRKTVLSSAGKAIGAEVVDSPEALKVGEEIMQALQWEGPLELELMRESETGRFQLIEINGRFPAWVGMSAEAGLNLPDLLLRIALNEPIDEAARAKIGTTFLRTSHTTVGKVKQIGELLASGTLEHTR